MSSAHFKALISRFFFPYCSATLDGVVEQQSADLTTSTTLLLGLAFALHLSTLMLCIYFQVGFSFVKWLWGGVSMQSPS